MNQIQETKSLLLFEEVDGETKKIFRQHKEDENEEKVSIYEINGDTIKYNFDGESIKEIIFEGFSELPDIINPFGYGFQERSLQNFFKFNIDDNQVDKLVISESSKSKKSRKKLYLNLNEIEELLSRINQEQRACNDTKKILIRNFLVEVNPGFNFDHRETNNNKQLILRNLNNKLMSCQL